MGFHEYDRIRRKNAHLPNHNNREVVHKLVVTPEILESLSKVLENTELSLKIKDNIIIISKKDDTI